LTMTYQMKKISTAWGLACTVLNVDVM